MIKTMRGDIQLGISIQEGQQAPQTEEERYEAIRSEMGADLLVILWAQIKEMERQEQKEDESE